MRRVWATGDAVELMMFRQATIGLGRDVQILRVTLMAASRFVVIRHFGVCFHLLPFCLPACMNAVPWCAWHSVACYYAGERRRKREACAAVACCCCCTRKKKLPSLVAAFTWWAHYGFYHHHVVVVSRGSRASGSFTTHCASRTSGREWGENKRRCDPSLLPVSSCFASLLMGFFFKLLLLAAVQQWIRIVTLLADVAAAAEAAFSL